MYSIGKYKATTGLSLNASTAFLMAIVSSMILAAMVSPSLAFVVFAIDAIGGTMYIVSLSARGFDLDQIRDPMRALTNMSFLDGAIGVVIVVFLVGALVGPIANFTTGITIAHTGFTPNPNVTQSPGAAPLLQIYPLFFVIFGLVVIAKYLSGEGRGL